MALQQWISITFYAYMYYLRTSNYRGDPFSSVCRVCPKKWKVTNIGCIGAEQINGASQFQYPQSVKIPHCAIPDLGIYPYISSLDTRIIVVQYQFYYLLPIERPKLQPTVQVPPGTIFGIGLEYSYAVFDQLCRLFGKPASKEISWQQTCPSPICLLIRLTRADSHMPCWLDIGIRTPSYIYPNYLYHII